MDSYSLPHDNHVEYPTSSTYYKSVKYKHNSRPSNSLLSYSPRKFRTHSSSVEPTNRSNGPSTELKRHSYLESREQTTSLELSQGYDNQFGYPTELLDQFHSSECELCNIQFTAPIMSKMHYSGKQHLKKVEHFMKRWSSITGNQVPYFAGDKFASSDATKPEYCELCDVEMKTLNEKILHISGKKHLKNTTDPSKLNRSFRKRKLGQDEKVDENFFGETFQQTEIFKKGAVNVMSAAINRFECKLCGVMSTSESNLLAHLNGKKHKERFGNKDLEMNKAHTVSCLTWMCKPCKRSFENKQDMEEHKQTMKHKLSLLNQDDGDRIIPGFEHWYCMTCKAQFKGSKEYTEHLFEEKHMRLEMNCTSLQKYIDLFYCTVCDLFVGQEEKDGHMNELEHRRKTLKNHSMKLIMDMANTDDNTLYYSCPDCPDAGSMNFIKFNNHLLTNAHTDRVLKRKSSE